MATRHEREQADRSARKAASTARLVLARLVLARLVLACLVLACLPGSPAAAQEAAPAAAPTATAPVPASETPQVAPGAAPVPGEAPAAGTAAPQPVETPAPAVPSDAAGPGIRIAHNLPSDLSPWGMFLAADIVVKAVMVGLAFASLVTWTVWLSKSLELGRARLLAARGVAALGRSPTLDDAGRELDGRRGAVAALVQAAAEEVALSSGALDQSGGGGLKERVASRLARVEAGAARRMTRGTGLLATIGSTAPFVGLFGTVWGIMNSFIGISESQTTNLAIVAPGIAEALLATAIGLVAAIPAVVIYNLFARATAAYRQILGDASAAVERLVSRDLDFRTVPRERRMAAE